MSPVSDHPPEWPLELARLQAALRAAGLGPAREPHRAALWRLLAEALERLLRGYARRAGGGAYDEIEDIASDKALEMVARAESGAWDITGRSAGEIVSYISRTARNGWLDHRARARLETPLPWETDSGEEWTPADDPHGSDPYAERAHESVEAEELSFALRSCIERLSDRDRRVWFFRAYYEMSSRQIAEHPGVQLRPEHVDVINQRARAALRECVHGKGHDLVEIPARAFVTLWEVLEGLARRNEAPAQSSARAREPR